MPHPVPPVAVVAGAQVTVALLAPWIVRARARNIPEPTWAAELAGYREWLPSRVPTIPPETLRAFDRCVASLAGQGSRSARLVIPRPPQGEQISIAAARLLTPDVKIIVSESTATGPAGIAAAAAAHETRRVPAALRLAAGRGVHHRPGQGTRSDHARQEIPGHVLTPVRSSQA